MFDLSAIALARVYSLPTHYKKGLVDRFGSADQLFKAVQSNSGQNREEDQVFALLKSESDFAKAEAEVKKLQKLGAWCLAYSSPLYPRLLKEIIDPPSVLFGLGELPKNDLLFLSVVGPRKASAYGLRVAKMICSDLANEGLVLVSGLARGVDAVAHESAIQANTPTIAVLGCGIDQIYPPEHSLLKSKISSCGSVISEFFVGESAQAWHFPLRNRIISGLSKGLLLVEAGEKSGARISARHAIEQSRDLYAIPGPIDAPLSMLPNQYISQGAKLISSSADILEDYFPDKNPGTQKTQKEKKLAELSTEAKRLLEFLELDQPIGVEDIMNRGKLQIGEVLQSLLELELKGIVAKQNDARYVRVVS